MHGWGRFVAVCSGRYETRKDSVVLGPELALESQKPRYREAVGAMPEEGLEPPTRGL